MADRTDKIGNCYEYMRSGKMLAGTDRMTIDQMIALSAKWPNTFHVYDSDGVVVWARAGREVPAPAFAA